MYEFTAIVPAYNAEDTLSDTIDSAKRSGASRVIVINDGSTDRTGEIARSLGAEVIETQRQGPQKARMIGLNRAKSEIVMFIDADDQLIPRGVRMAIAKLIDDRSICGVVGKHYLVGANGKVRMNPERPGNVDSHSLLERGYPPGPPAAFVWRRNAVEKSQNLDLKEISSPHAEDYQLVIRASIVGSIASIDEPMCRYRVSGGRSSNAPALMDEDQTNLRAYYGANLGIEFKIWSWNRRKASRYLRRAGARRADGRYLEWFALSLIAASIDPGSVLRAVTRRVDSCRNSNSCEMSTES